jgi:hypothetical protein
MQHYGEGLPFSRYRKLMGLQMENAGKRNRMGTWLHFPTLNLFLIGETSNVRVSRPGDHVDPKFSFPRERPIRKAKGLESDPANALPESHH